MKGRAASSTPVLRSDLYSSHMYYPSQVNRADGPTRHSAPPDVALPEWWGDLLAGSYDAFDAWAQESEESVAGSPFDCSSSVRRARRS